METKAVIFDVSGTILDDIQTVWKANSDAYWHSGFGGFETLEEFKAKFKLPIPEFHRANGIPKDLIGKIEEDFRKFYPQYAPLVRIFPEVKPTLSGLRERGILLGIASNIPSLFLREHLEEFGIKDLFDAIVGQEDCDEQKPSPKPILITLAKLKIDPARVIYVGDMEEDILAGKRAGVQTVAITREGSYHPDWKLKRQNPDYLISDLIELLNLVKKE